MDDYKLDYYNIDISRVTLTVRQEDVDRVRALLGNLALGKRYYGGWINPENPSPSPLGFFIVFDNQTMYADFHNLPYYYYNFHTKVSYWDEYHWVIVSYVRKHPAFSLWEGQWSRFDASLLPILVNLLNKLATSSYFSRFQSIVLSDMGHITGQGDRNGI